MARLKRICDTCNKPIPQVGEHWHMVEKTVEPGRWELFKAFWRGKQVPVVTKKVPLHHDCEHPEKRARLDRIVDMVRDEASPTEKEFENV